MSKVNLSNIEDNDRFGPDVQFGRRYQSSSAIAVVGWSSNSLGTELTEYVFANSARALHFIDPGDMQGRKKDIPSLLKVIRDAKAILSVKMNIILY